VVGVHPVETKPPFWGIKPSVEPQRKRNASQIGQANNQREGVRQFSDRAMRQEEPVILRRRPFFPWERSQESIEPPLDPAAPRFPGDRSALSHQPEFIKAKGNALIVDDVLEAHAHPLTSYSDCLTTS